MRVGLLINERSRNVGGSQILSSKKRGGSSTNPTPNPPSGLTLSKTLNPNGTWKLDASWGAALPATPSLLGYTLELQQTISDTPTWGNTQNLTATSFSYASTADGQYKVRLKARYTFGDSYWIESSVENAFVNMAFDASNLLSFHTLVFSN